jgi:hypothetical protein
MFFLLFLFTLNFPVSLPRFFVFGPRVHFCQFCLFYYQFNLNVSLSFLILYFYFHIFSIFIVPFHIQTPLPKLHGGCRFRNLQTPALGEVRGHQGQGEGRVGDRLGAVGQAKAVMRQRARFSRTCPKSCDHLLSTCREYWSWSLEQNCNGMTLTKLCLFSHLI